jgi:hypothetical protein
VNPNHPDPSPGSSSGAQSRAGLSRRTFIGAAGAAGSAGALVALAGADPASAATRAALARQRSMIMQVAQAGTKFPVAFRAGGQAAARAAVTRLPHPWAAAPAAMLTLSAHQPASGRRVALAEQRMSADQVALAHTVAGTLVSAGLPGRSTGGLLEGIAQHAAAAPAGGDPALLAMVTLAIATVFPAFDPGSDAAARQWTGILRIMHQRGTLHAALQRRNMS